MPPHPDLSGRTFGRLTVIRRGPPGDRRGRVWVCRCACGNEPSRPPTTSDLMSDRVTSCGCAAPAPRRSGGRPAVAVPPDRREAFAARHSAGASLRELRDEFSLSSREVARQWVHRLGLPPHPHGGRKRERTV